MAVYTHQTVLLNEAVDALVTLPDAHYIDGTFGRGGHSRLILQKLASQGRLTAFDRDLQAVAAARSIVDDRFSVVHTAFSALAALPADSIQGVLLDLGISSPQIDDADRGFSFRQDGPLDMRMDSSAGVSAADWLVRSTVEDIENVIHKYGEERFARKIAQAIKQHIANKGCITRTLELAQLVANIVKARDGAQHPATRTFQALRIVVNAELEQLQLALHAALRALQVGGRLVVISFHSLEDRMVKQFMASHAREQFHRDDPSWMLERQQQPMPLRLLGRIKPTDEEVMRNPRARSAVMRIAERTQAPFALAGAGI